MRCSLYATMGIVMNRMRTIVMAMRISVTEKVCVTSVRIWNLMPPMLCPHPQRSL